MAVYYKKDESMIGRQVANEFMLVPIRQNAADLGYIYILDGVGGYIWGLLDDHATINDIVTSLTREYAVDAKQAEADVVEFLTQMKEIGAVSEKISED